MKKYLVQAGLVIVVAGGIYALMSWNAGSNSAPQDDHSLNSPTQLQQAETPQDSVTKEQSQSAQTEAKGVSNDVAAKSLRFQTTVLKGFYKARNPVPALLDYLEKAGQIPVKTSDYNDVTGEMVIIRTNNPAPGTRYFHTQAFTDENGVQFIQHMSFEFKAGTQSMSSAKAIAQEIFQVGKPGMERSDFMQWELPDGYTLWVKQLTADDIKDMAEDEFNAYSPSDVGVVRVAIEQNPHH